MIALLGASNTITMRSCCLIVLLLIATSVNGQDESEGSVSGGSGFYQAAGPSIVDPDGMPFLPKGMSLNGYLFPDVYGLKLYNDETSVMNSPSQAYKKIGQMLGDPKKEQEIWDAYHQNFLTEDDVKHLAGFGFNAVRLPFNYRMLSPWDSPGEYLEEGFEKIDKVIKWCKESGMAVLLDMHSAPGGQSHDGFADPEHSYWYFHEELQEWRERGVQVLLEANQEYTKNTGRTPASNQQRTADIWREIAARYVNEEAILGYELVNEPYWYVGPTPNQVVRDFYISVTDAIREVDPNHMILVEGNLFGEEIEGLLSPWDDNMVIAFHRFWRETGYEDGRVLEYIKARDNYEVPFVMTESGENSNPWMYEMSTLMESNNIGWFFKGYKKVDSIACAYKVQSSEDYRYVMENWNDPSEIDQERAYKGLKDLTIALETENCQHEPGFVASLLEDSFNKKSREYGKQLTLPGIIQATDYDVGNQGIAYNDEKYKQNDFVDGPWNGGWSFRNDGVDIYVTDNDLESNGFHVSGITPGEWMKYTVHVEASGNYRVSFRVAATWGQTGKIGRIQLFGGGNQFKPMDVVSDGPSGSWWTQYDWNVYRLEEGKITLLLFFVEGDMKLGWMNFQKLDKNGLPEGILVINTPLERGPPLEPPEGLIEGGGSQSRAESDGAEALGAEAHHVEGADAPGDSPPPEGEG